LIAATAQSESSERRNDGAVTKEAIPELSDHSFGNSTGKTPADNIVEANLAFPQLKTRTSEIVSSNDGGEPSEESEGNSFFDNVAGYWSHADIMDKKDFIRWFQDFICKNISEIEEKIDPAKLNKIFRMLNDKAEEVGIEERLPSTCTATLPGEPLLEGGRRSILGGIWDFIGIDEIIEKVKDTIGGKKNRQRMNSALFPSKCALPVRCIISKVGSPLCDSNGFTYKNDCDFFKAVCKAEEAGLEPPMKAHSGVC